MSHSVLAGLSCALVIQRYHPFQGGSERYFEAIAGRLVEERASVDVVTTDAWDLEYFWDKHRKRIPETTGSHDGTAIHRVPVRHLPAGSFSHRAIRRVMAESATAGPKLAAPVLPHLSRFGPWVPGLGRKLRDLGPFDVIHSANVAFESMIAAAETTARATGAAHIVTPFVHLGEGPRSKVRRYYTMPHQLDLLRRADAVTALTSLEANYLVDAGVPSERVHLVGAGIDIAASTGGDARRACETFQLEGRIVLSLGAAAFDKGTFHLAEAVIELSRHGLPVTLVVAGPLLTEFERFLARKDFAARSIVRAVGFVSEEQKKDLLAAADVVALPSRTESFGLVFYEAWANRKPVVGARAGAIPSVVSDRENGLLVDFGDVPALTSALDMLLNDDALATRLGEAGQRQVISEDEWLDRIVVVYRSVLSG